MSWDELHFDGVDESFIKRQKAKARELRKSRWWKNKIAPGLCHYCGRQFIAAELTMDHIVPIGRGGMSTKNNLAPCCKECNNNKKNMLPQEWDDYMRRVSPE